MSLERRIAEINPAAAQVGIYNEKLLPTPKSKQRLKVAAVTGNLEVFWGKNLNLKSFSFFFIVYSFSGGL